MWSNFETKKIKFLITEPSTEIIGSPDLYIESGSTINLTCVVSKNFKKLFLTV